MEHPKESDAFSVGGELHTALLAGVAEIALMPEGEQRAWALRGVASMLIETPESFKAAAFELCPELAVAEPIPDTYLSAEERELAARLTLADMQEVDRALIAGAVGTWRKMARVVGHAMVTLQGQVPDLPLGVYMQRIEALVRDARLEAQGDIRFIRLCEVRLPSTGTRAAAQATRAE